MFLSAINPFNPKLRRNNSAELWRFQLNLLSSRQTSRDENLEAKLPGGGGRVKGGTLCQDGSYAQLAGEQIKIKRVIVARTACPLYGSSAPVKVVRNRTTRCARVFLFAAPPLTVLAEPGLGWLGFRAGICAQIRTHQQNLS